MQYLNGVCQLPFLILTRVQRVPHFVQALFVQPTAALMAKFIVRGCVLYLDLSFPGIAVSFGALP